MAQKRGIALQLLRLAALVPVPQQLEPVRRAKYARFLEHGSYSTARRVRGPSTAASQAWVRLFTGESGRLEVNGLELMDNVLWRDGVC